MNDHDLRIVSKGDELLVDNQRGGGLLLQIGVERDGETCWNFIKLPKRLADRLRKFIAEKGQTP